MDTASNSKKVLITRKDLKGLHRLSRSLIKELQELREDPHLSRRAGVVQQLDEALQNARDTKETLREIYIRNEEDLKRFITCKTLYNTESLWSTKKVCHKSTQTSQNIEEAHGPDNKQWERVGQMVNEMKQTIAYGSGRLHAPLVNESVSHRYHEWWCEQSNQHLVPTLKHWLDLWADERASEEEHKGGKSVGKSNRKTTEAEEMVAHFQKLFDVPTKEGVYPRLNDVYNRLGELLNVLHVLKDMLGLDKDEPVSRVVTVVKKLCDLHSESSTHLLRYLLQADDLDRMILKIDDYNKFFPTFEKVAKELMTILEVDHLNQLIPAAKALKLLQP